MGKVYRQYQFHIYQGDTFEVVITESFDVIEAIKYIASIRDLSLINVKQIYDASDMLHHVCIYNDDSPTPSPISAALQEQSNLEYYREYVLYSKDGCPIERGNPNVLYSMASYRRNSIVCEVFGIYNPKYNTTIEWVGRKYAPNSVQ